MNIVSNDTRGTISLHANDPQDNNFLWNLRRLVERGKLHRYIESEEIVFDGGYKRLALMFKLDGNTYNRLSGTTNEDDYNLRNIERSIIAADSGLIYLNPIYKNRTRGVEVTIARCDKCNDPLIEFIQCRNGFCDSCKSFIEAQHILYKRGLKASKEGVIEMEWFRSYKGLRAANKTNNHD